MVSVSRAPHTLRNLRLLVSHLTASVTSVYVAMGAPRSQHKAFAFNYIAKFSQQEKGTGGSDFMVRAAALLLTIPACCWDLVDGEDCPRSHCA